MKHIVTSQDKGKHYFTNKQNFYNVKQHIIAKNM